MSNTTWNNNNNNINNPCFGCKDKFVRVNKNSKLEIMYNRRFQAERSLLLQKSEGAGVLSSFACIPSIPAYSDGESVEYCEAENFSFKVVNGELIDRAL